jgi:cytoskeletal protein CcmA (bactofilin family)
MANSVDKNTLIVGEDIRLKGEITSCDKLVIEGHVEISLTNGRQIEIGPSGVFTGQAEVQEADISGHFDGELTAHERLVVRSTGHITGTIRYGRIVIEAGGEIVGSVEAMTSANAGKPAREAASKTSDQPAPAPSGPGGAASARKSEPELEIPSRQE